MMRFRYMRFDINNCKRHIYKKSIFWLRAMNQRIDLSYGIQKTFNSILMKAFYVLIFSQQIPWV